MKNKLKPFQYRFKDLLIHFLFFTIYGIVKYLPPPLGDWLRYGVLKLFVRKMGAAKISEGVTIRYPYLLTIGNGVSINEWGFIDAPGEVEIGNKVRIGHRVSIVSSSHNFKCTDISIYEQGISVGKIIIEDNVWIGCNVTILPNLKIGNDSIIGANSVVTKDIPPFSIAVGSPARVKKTRTQKNQND